MRSFKKIELPQDFAQRILDNEIEFRLSQQPSKQVVCNLVELYSMGVEYYQSIKSYKYLYFQKKMTQIFSSPTKVFASSTDPETEKKQSSPIKQKIKSGNDAQKLEAIKIKEKQQKMQNEVIEKTNIVATGKEIQKILASTKQKGQNVEHQIKEQIQNQNSRLEQKILQRKKKMVTKSFSSFDLIQVTQTRQSLFAESPTKLSNQKSNVEPLLVNFEELIKEGDSDEEDLMEKSRPRLTTKGKVTSLFNLHEV